LIVTALSAAFGVALIQGTSYLVTMVAADDISSRSTVQLALMLVSGAFIAIAVYVGAIVTANTFSTIIAGRTRTIALMRLIGSSALAQRQVVARQGLMIGLVGSLLGGVFGYLSTTLGRGCGVASGVVPDRAYEACEPVDYRPSARVVQPTWAGSWVGARKVLTVTPLQSTVASQGATREQTLKRPVRNALA